MNKMWGPLFLAVCLVAGVGMLIHGTGIRSTERPELLFIAANLACAVVTGFVARYIPVGLRLLVAVPVIFMELLVLFTDIVVSNPLAYVFTVYLGLCVGNTGYEGIQRTYQALVHKSPV